MAHKRRHGLPHEEEKENHERWLISYADMITLLMVFFVVLFSMSTLDATKYRAIAESFAEALGGGSQDTAPTSELDLPGQPTPAPSGVVPSGQPVDAQQQAAKELQEAIKDAGLAKEVRITTDERGVVLMLTNALLFNEGRAEIKAAGRDILGKLGPLLRKYQKPLVIEGHTDSQPISTFEFPSNWELSTTRATAVLRYLINRGIAPKLLTAAGYADTHPRGSNQTEAGRAENRRVEIILVIKPDAARPAIGAIAASQVPMPSSTALPSLADATSVPMPSSAPAATAEAIPTPAASAGAADAGAGSSGGVATDGSGPQPVASLPDTLASTGR